jgi:transposase
MLKLTPHQRLLLAIEPVDFRRNIDGLAAICKQKLKIDPFSGTVFAFTNRKHNAVKLLIFDTNGFWLCMKRFSNGKLAWWPAEAIDSIEIQAEALSVLLSQGDPRFMFTPLPWRKLTEAGLPSQASGNHPDALS